MKDCFILLILLFSHTIIFSKERIDTNLFELKFNPENFMMNIYPEPQNYLSNENLKEANIEKYLLGDEFNKFKLTYSFIYEKDHYTSYLYNSKYFNFYTHSYPTTISFDFHLKPLLKLNKLDIYFFGSGMFSNEWSIDKYGVFQVSNSRDFLWETGVGIQYEIYKNLFIFYEYSKLNKNEGFFSSDNKTKFPSFHRAGIKFRF